MKMPRAKLDKKTTVFISGFATSMLVITILFFVACQKKEPIQIGFVGGLSGRVADFGIAGRNGAILAVENRNRSGGVRGKTVELVVRDDEQDVETARRVVGELLDQEVTAIIGPMTSAMSMATVPLANERHVVMMSPTTSTKYLGGLDDYFFRVLSTTEPYAQRMAQYLRKTRKLDAVSVVYDLRNREYSESWLDSFRKAFEALGGTIAQVETFHSGPDVHFFQLAKRALGPKPEGLIIIAGAMDAAILCQQVRKIEPAIPIIASAWSATENLIDLGGAAVEGILVPQWFDRNSTDPSYLAFRDAFIERFGKEPGFASVAAYDAVTVVLDALEKTSSDRTLKEAILRISEFQGVQGKVTIDRYGDASREYFLLTVENGKFKVLK